MAAPAVIAAVVNASPAISAAIASGMPTPGMATKNGAATSSTMPVMKSAVLFCSIACTSGLWMTDCQNVLWCASVLLILAVPSAFLPSTLYKVPSVERLLWCKKSSLLSYWLNVEFLSSGLLRCGST